MGDEETGEDEEEVDPDEATGDGGEPGVEEQDEVDGNGTEPVERWPVSVHHARTLSGYTGRFGLRTTTQRLVA